VRFEEAGVAAKGWTGDEVVIPYAEILTAERLRSRRGVDLHVVGRVHPMRVRCGGGSF
jgi:hypothetical protein